VLPKISFVPTLSLAIAATIPRPMMALAQGNSDPLVSPRLPVAPSTLPMTPSQIEAFANLVDEPIDTVAGRLRQDPSLVPFALAAADARLDRKGSGKGLAIGGFTLFGLGVSAGIFSLLDTLAHQNFLCGMGDSEAKCPSTPMSSRDKAIGIGGLVAAGVGLMIAIPGVLRMARQSDMETATLDRYKPPVRLYESPIPIESACSMSTGPGIRTISVRALALAF